ncbi:MAG: hypothetical protein RLZZ165_1256 [Bacteroidota bacterium]
MIHTRLLYRGGLESRLFYYMSYFHEKGHAVTVCVGKRDPAVQVPEGVEVKRFRVRWLPKIFRAWFFDRLLRRYFSTHDFDLRVSLGRTTCHDALIVAGNHRAFLKAVGRRGGGISDLLQEMMDDRSYRAPGVLLAASEMLRDQMVEFHGIPPERIRILYPPTDARIFHPGLKSRRTEFRRKHGFGPGRRSFLFVSANHDLKGLPILLQVFSELADLPVELLVVGGKPVRTALPHVRHLGFVREPEEIYAAGDFTLLPSKYDSFGQVVTESLLCGTPVIVSGMTGAKAIVRAGEGIVVDSFTPAAWKAAILQALDMTFHIDPDLARHNGLRFEDHMARILECAGAARIGQGG